MYSHLHCCPWRQQLHGCVRAVQAGRQGARTAAVRTSSPSLWPRLQKPHLRSSRSSPLLLEPVPLSSPSLERGRFSPWDAITWLRWFGAAGVEGRRSVSFNARSCPAAPAAGVPTKSAFEFKTSLVASLAVCPPLLLSTLPYRRQDLSGPRPTNTPRGSISSRPQSPSLSLSCREGIARRSREPESRPAEQGGGVQ